MSARARGVRTALAAAAAAAALALLPAAFHNQAVLDWAFLVCLYAALAQSWNLLGGFAGQVNLGLAAFFGLGAVVARTVWLAGASPGAALATGTAAAGAMGVVIGGPCLRLRGPYFAIGTLAASEILRLTVANALPNVSSLPARVLAAYALAPRYELALGLLAAVTGTAWWLTRSRFGRGLAAVREDEGVAEAIGVHAFRHKLAAFIMSALFAGATGGVFGFYQLSFYPSSVFDPLWTFDPLLIVYLGGVGTVLGPLVGAAFFLLLREALSLRLGDYHLLVFGALFLIVVIALPGGFMEALRALSGRRRVHEYG